MSYLLIKNTLLFSTKLCYPNSFLEMFLMFLKGEIADKQCHPKHFCEGMTHIFLTDEGEKHAPSYFYLNWCSGAVQFTPAL